VPPQEGVPIDGDGVFGNPFAPVPPGLDDDDEDLGITKRLWESGCLFFLTWVKRRPNLTSSFRWKVWTGWQEKADHLPHKVSCIYRFPSLSSLCTFPNEPSLTIVSLNRSINDKSNPSTEQPLGDGHKGWKPLVNKPFNKLRIYLNQPSLRLASRPFLWQDSISQNYTLFCTTAPRTRTSDGLFHALGFGNEDFESLGPHRESGVVTQSCNSSIHSHIPLFIPRKKPRGGPIAV